MASTSEELSSQAEQLQQTMGFFRIEGNGSSAKALKSVKVVSKTAGKLEAGLHEERKIGKDEPEQAHDEEGRFFERY
jgi:methyl-accepting chemotaxis protein